MADCDNDQECEKIVPGEITPEPLPTPSGGGGTKDFNALDNRPKYDGVKMTGDTNIPDLSGSVSQLGTDVSGIQGVIPEAATAQNQLADKNFVNSSVATNTAYFVGTFNSVADLEAVQNPSNNDYGFVVSTDSAGNTIYNRYKYNASTSAWVFEYALNNSSFTADQWAAINSAITSGDVTKLQGLAEIKSVSTGLGLDANGALTAKLYTETGNNTDGSMTQKSITEALAGTGGSAIKVLTTDDYYEGGEYVKLWELADGFYYRDSSVAARISPYRSLKASQNLIDVTHDGNVVNVTAVFGKNTSVANGITEFGWVAHILNNQEQGFAGILTSNEVRDNLTADATTGAVQPLSAYQGKVLKDLIDALDARITALGG